MAYKGRKGPDANYSFKKKEPEAPMGSGSYANMPSEPIMRAFSTNHEYRDGLRNSFVSGLDELSDIEENQR